MALVRNALIELGRDCEATLIPGGEKATLSQGDRVAVTQALGGSFTVTTDRGYLARIEALDADALGLDPGQRGAARSRPF